MMHNSMFQNETTTASSWNLTVFFIHVIQEGYSGFSSCQGCRRCECGPASIRSTCHPLTHSCPCRPGAGGRYCERCLPGYWDYSPSGCQSKSSVHHTTCQMFSCSLEKMSPDHLLSMQIKLSQKKRMHSVLHSHAHYHSSAHDVREASAESCDPVARDAPRRTE